MAKRKSPHAQDKRRREISKQKKRQEKLARKSERRDEKPEGAGNPDAEHPETEANKLEIHHEPGGETGTETGPEPGDESSDGPVVERGF